MAKYGWILHITETETTLKYFEAANVRNMDFSNFKIMNPDVYAISLYAYRLSFFWYVFFFCLYRIRSRIRTVTKDLSFNYKWLTGYFVQAYN